MVNNMEKLNERIQFISIETLIDEAGFSTEEEFIFYECWANYKPLSGKEFIAAYTNNSKNTVSFRVRSCNKLKKITSLSHKIKFRNKLYNIVYINDIKKDYWDLKCEVVE